MKRYLIIFVGRVQGVGFRYTYYNIALKYNLLGQIKNLDNGNVEAIVQGKEEDIYKSIIEITKVKSFIKIEDYFLKELDIDDKLKNFKITY